LNLLDWLPAGFLTAVIAVAAPFAGLFLKSWIERTLQADFDRRIEELRARLKLDEERLRAELQARDAQISALRTGALSGMAARQGLIGERRIRACEVLWGAVVDLGPLKTASAMTIALNMNAMIERAEGSGHDAKKLRDFADTMWKSLGLDGHKHDPTPDRERLFISPISWSLFTAYRRVLSYPVIQLAAVRTGGGPGLLKDPPTEILDVVKAALPHQVEYIDKYGAVGLGFLIQQLEDRLLAALKGDVSGSAIDEETVGQAADIIRKVASADAAMSRSELPKDSDDLVIDPIEPT
jgi:hypothetical protein